MAKKTTKTVKKPAYTEAQKKKDLGELKKDYFTDLKQLKKHSVELKKQVDLEYANVKKKMEADYKKAKITVAKAKKTFIAKKKKSKVFIRKHPFLSVAMAATGGILLNKIFGKKRRK